MTSFSHDPSSFAWPVRVYYEDTDAGGVVYYANYLRFLERARTEWLRNKGVEQTDLLARHRLVFVVSQIHLDYLKPARFNELLSVRVLVASVGRASLEFRQTIENNGVECVRAQVKVVCVDSVSFRPSRIPHELIQLIESGEHGH
ncbi:MAG: tol-pal system-associated acyl-CoA thioesterase [Proteobacteria bacterium]|nr:tol-pal system-associated acyl-CoA thioesterase [Pseudomonadota bacterium]MDE3207313.1 tol-pal system-associated acyl-CoA thioesterase [Pseudomonadota bacterium]